MSLNQLALTSLKKSYVVLTNALLDLAPTQHLQAHDNTLTLQRPQIAETTPGEGLELTFCRIGKSAAVSVYVGFDDLTSLLFEWLSGANLTLLPDTILHAACEQWLQKNRPTNTSSTWHITSVRRYTAPITASAGQYLVRFPLSDSVNTCQLYALASDSVWPELLSGLARAPANSDDIPLSVSLRLANLKLDTNTLTTLEIGDVLLCESEDKQLALMINGSPVFLADLNASQVTLCKYWNQAMNDTPNTTHQHTPQTVGDDTNAPDIGALPVNIQLLLPLKTLNVAQVQQLTEGQTLSLDADAEKHIALCINDQIMGTGELVNIEGQLGVRIAKWSNHGH